MNEHHVYTGFDVSGHAEFSDPGKDVVCAAVSMLVINTMILGLESLEENSEYEPYIDIIFEEV